MHARTLVSFAIIVLYGALCSLVSRAWYSNSNVDNWLLDGILTSVILISPIISFFYTIPVAIIVRKVRGLRLVIPTGWLTSIEHLIMSFISLVMLYMGAALNWIYSTKIAWACWAIVASIICGVIWCLIPHEETEYDQR